MEETDLSKSLADKNIIERHTFAREDGKYDFRIASALLEIDARLKLQEEKQKRADEALSFLATWWEEKHGSGLIVPETPKIIL